jgi:hypothetical protein
VADEQYYIHIEDPGFPEEPWPGQRRMGPYLTQEEAVEQAASDISTGAGGGVVGIFTTSASDEMRDQVEGTAPAVDLETLTTRADEITSDRLDKAAEAESDEGAAMKAVLEATGVTVTDEMIRDLLQAARLIG